ncbi:ATP-dependent peptidase M41 family protein [Rhizobium gallicum]|uniref:ATP-dependent peptidase M41 family protein n=1 Tax=Rhizobium gallicum TaxID=56730 RepID=A0A1L5NI34_9HYPH|nr:AAA family ATPase [Rhizobium gallicum]APO67519.1 ATP-dependent peptidase M41 family protein [Rhizobium gallicum]
MDKALADQLDRYIYKLREASRSLKGSRSVGEIKTKHDNAAIAMKSAEDFLVYCALIQFVRRNIGSLSRPSCVALVSVPSHWPLSDVDDAAKIVFNNAKQFKICLHPTSKHRRGWEIDAAELLALDKLIIFVQAGSVVHEDFELAATVRDRLHLCDAGHVRALSKLRGCGVLSDDQVAVIAQQPSERMEAIFRRGQPASRAAERLVDGRNKPTVRPAQQLDLSKGFGEAGVWAKELKRDVQDWRDGNLPWSEVDKGCLLYGPPGTGKTRFAAALAAECGLHLEAASISKWQSFKDGDLGDMLKAMYRAFDAAREDAPSLLFIDEFDSIGDRSKFPSRHETYSTTVVNALLECLDGIGDREGVVVLGACNHPQKIDPALLRSGRLERHVEFPLPDAVARSEILAFHLPSLSEEPALKEIGARLPGKSGADIERLAREARRIARHENRPVTVDDVRARIQVPAPLDAATLHRTAVHEAGHAIVTHALFIGKIERVEIYDNVHSFATLRDANGLTVTEIPPREFVTRWDMMKMITMHLAGAAAEDLVFGHRANWSSGTRESDLFKATILAIKMVTEYGFGNSLYFLPNSVDIESASKLWEDLPLRDEVTEILREQYQRARDMLDGLRPTLLKLADALVKERSLDAVQLERYWPGAAKRTSVLRQ